MRVFQSKTHVWGSLRLLCLIAITTFLLIPANTHAQNESGDTPLEYELLNEPEQPEYLAETHSSAARNMLYQILGKIAQAAGGDMTLADAAAAFDTDQENQSSNAVDSVIASMMYIFNLAILGGLSFFLFFTINLMVFQAGIEGKAFNDRYNGWAAVRVVASVLSIMPLIGGWSMGQYGVIKFTMFGSDTADTMNRASNRWLYSQANSKPLALNTTAIRTIIKDIYQNEICLAVANQAITQETTNEATQLGKFETLKQEAKTDSGKSLYQQVIDSISETYTPPLISSTETEVEENGAYYFAINWGSSKTSPNSCGSVMIDYDGSSYFNADHADQGGRNAAITKNYLEAHKKAITETLTKAQQQVAASSAIYNSILTGVSGATTDERITNQASAFYSKANSNTTFGAIGYLLDTNGISAKSLTNTQNSEIDPTTNHSQSTPSYEKAQIQYDQLISAAVSDYKKHLTTEYNSLAVNLAESFDAQLDLYKSHMRTESEKEHSTANQVTLIDDVGTNHSSSLSDSANGADLSNSEFVSPGSEIFIKNAEKGWLFAGYKWWDVSRSQLFINEITKINPNGISFETQSGYHPEESRDALNAYSRQLRFVNMARNSSAPINGEDGDLTHCDPSTKSCLLQVASDFDGVGGFLQKYRSIMSTWMSDSLGHVTFDFEHNDLLSELQETGHAFIAAAEAIFVVRTVAETTSAVLETASDAPSVKILSWIPIIGDKPTMLLSAARAFLKKLASALLLIEKPLWIAGIVLGVYLPMLPAIHWTFAVVGWIQHVIETLVATPLWGAAHAAPEGSGLVGQHAANGWKMLLNLAAFPAVLLFSLHFAMLILGSLGALLHEVYFAFIPSMNFGTSAVGIASFLVAPVTAVASYLIFLAFLVAVCHRVLAWIPEMAERMPLYIGGGAANLGNQHGAGRTDSAFGAIIHNSNGVGAAMKNPNAQKGGGSQPPKGAQGSQKGFHGST